MMSETVLIVAPHPDDEILGCGGTILRHIDEGDTVHWCLFTEMRPRKGITEDQIAERDKLIASVAACVPFNSCLRLGFESAALEETPKRSMVEIFATALNSIRPSIVYAPFKYDAHSDHCRVSNVVSAACKPFRAPYVKKLLAYETLSETNQVVESSAMRFTPNYYVDITKFSEKKRSLLMLYKTELGEHPFPRSIEAVSALEILRGSEANVLRAESFMILRAIH